MTSLHSLLTNGHAPPAAAPRRCPSRAGAEPRAPEPPPPTTRLRLLIADPDPAVRVSHRAVITGLGHLVVGEAADGLELVEIARDERPDVLVTEARMHGLDGIGAATEICREWPVPVILVTDGYDPAVAARAAAGPVLAYLLKPIDPGALAAALAIGVTRFKEVDALHREVIDLRQALADRKVIERAKGVLMKKGGLSEEEAFHRLQRLARDTNTRVVDIARSVLTAEAALTGDAHG